MTWDAYDARTLREADDIIDTAACMLAAMCDVLKKLARGQPDETLRSQIEYLECAIDDACFDRKAIEEAMANTPEGREIARQERPAEPVRI